LTLLILVSRLIREANAEHKSGDINYTNLIWKNVTQLNRLKDKLESSHPTLRLQISVDLENLNQLQSLIEKAVAHDFKEVEFFLHDSFE
jgi:hypothetical protein